MPNAEAAWLSCHVFFDGGIYRAPADRLLRRGLVPVIDACRRRGLARRFFFIRYMAGGPHLRLRLEPRSAAAAARIAALVERRLAPGDGGHAATAVTRLRWSAYRPEHERYGGRDGLAVAEDLFHRSSEAAIALLRKVADGDDGARQGKALLADLVLLHGFGPSRRAVLRLAGRYGDGFLRTMAAGREDRRQRFAERFDKSFERQARSLVRYVRGAWEALEHGTPLTPELDRLGRHARRAAARLEALLAAGRLQRDGAALARAGQPLAPIVLSYVHMLNNRLGVSQRQEAYLARLIRLSLEPRPAAVAHAAGGPHR